MIVKNATWGRDSKVNFTVDNNRTSIEVPENVWENELIEEARKIICFQYTDIENKDFSIQ